MNLEGYLYTINKNNNFRLNTDDLKDVKQEINIYLHNKSYNDLLVKKTVLSYYLKAVNKKIKNENIVFECEQFDLMENEPDETQERRLNALNKLNLNDKQKKIVKLLIEGYTYPEIRKRLKMNNSKLTSHIKRIKKTNYNKQ
jgi:DNA-binding CsgD family transcriptional regulator